MSIENSVIAIGDMILLHLAAFAILNPMRFQKIFFSMHEAVHSSKSVSGPSKSVSGPSKSVSGPSKSVSGPSKSVSDAVQNTHVAEDVDLAAEQSSDHDEPRLYRPGMAQFWGFCAIVILIIALFQAIPETGWVPGFSPSPLLVVILSLSAAFALSSIGLLWPRAPLAERRLGVAARRPVAATVILILIWLTLVGLLVAYLLGKLD